MCDDDYRDYITDETILGAIMLGKYEEDYYHRIPYEQYRRDWEKNSADNSIFFCNDCDQWWELDWKKKKKTLYFYDGLVIRRGKKDKQCANCLRKDNENVE
jgi:hypothetical protein